MSATKAPAVAGSSRANVAWGLVAGAGVNLVVTGPGFIVSRWQVREMAAEVGWLGDGLGRGFLISGLVLLALGLALLVFTYSRRSWVRNWWIASAAALVSFVITSELLAQVLFRNITAFI